ncbi:hypothetical protein HHL19_19905 [Streptomyces sp. R302]|uniref:hypothetical protein n=1 Tax=unclassified Streptomyces TaxID=2593676 RepID=UPI00145EC346|nr:MULTISPECIES: hypothetical protein [unclassified Streptomyces]NML50775.1 hypothetical protein [Streptomyces sp. R301]NML80870.1 hypothetical protein [Streptomyces sp. R302]
MAAKTDENETDASKWEYTTYAPSGETCPACMKPIGPLERVRRGTLSSGSGTSVVVYRHVACPKG